MARRAQHIEFGATVAPGSCVSMSPDGMYFASYSAQTFTLYRFPVKPHKTVATVALTSSDAVAGAGCRRILVISPALALVTMKNGDSWMLNFTAGTYRASPFGEVPPPVSAHAERFDQGNGTMYIRNHTVWFFGKPPQHDFYSVANFRYF